MDPASLLLGGVVAAGVTAVATSHRNRRELSQKLIEKYLELTDKVAESKGILQRKDLLPIPKYRNKVIYVTNWFEMACAWYFCDLADRDILDRMGFPEITKRWFEKLESAQMVKDGATTSAFDAKDFWDWRHLKALAVGKRPDEIDCCDR